MTTDRLTLDTYKQCAAYVVEAPIADHTDQAPSRTTAGYTQETDGNGAPPSSSADVLRLLRATPAISVSTLANRSTVYVVVPDTPAKGTADPNRTWSGMMADGRQVTIVPLDSGGQSGIGYALMWVSSGGRTQFVGEIPAENGGRGGLLMSVKGGKIYMQWPVYRGSDTSPSFVRKQVLTLDGVRLRKLSDESEPVRAGT